MLHGLAYFRQPIKVRQHTAQRKPGRVLPRPGNWKMFQGRKGKTELRGIDRELYGLIAAKHNFSESLRVITSGLGIRKNNLKPWSGSIGYLHRREADVALNFMALLYDRYQVVGYSRCPYADTAVGFVVEVPELARGHWKTWRRINYFFTPHVISALAGTCVTVFLVLLAMQWFPIFWEDEILRRRGVATAFMIPLKFILRQGYSGKNIQFERKIL